MANFNWFSRSFDKSAAEEADKPQAEETTTEKSSTESGDDASAQTTSSDDYLAWAKAAYQNIQKQQTPTADAAPTAAETAEAATEEEAAAEDSIAESESAESATVEAPDTPEPPTAVVAEGDEVAPETEPTEIEPPEPAESSSEESATAIADAPSTEAAADAPAEASGDRPAPEESPIESSPAAPTGPAWMQSAAERQARLERLQETAIAEPEPEPEPATTTPTATEPVLPDINFDEAFLWSAEVLAGQGRSAADISIEEITWLNKLRQGLDKTRRGLVNQLKAIVGQGPLNEDAVFEIEALLLQADVGVEATDTIIESLQAKLREEALPPEQAIAYLKKILRDMLDAPLGDSHNLEFVPDKDSFNIWLMTGVNGAGKTTTIGKLAHIAKKSGYSCIIGAADTFRAAAVEQVKAWGARSEVEVIANPGKNTDPAAVVFDAITAAQSRNCELLLVDTAGRLQNKKNLMDELSKIRRIIDKKAADAKVESLLVLDATLGQNGLQQAKVFAEVANLSGVVLTKLDGTARGGVALAVVQQLGLPIRFIGAGEGIEDLRPFSSYEFVEALLSG
ncbi:signal recognition particle-docking protein FtsY [Leptolyngbya iicbica]|uniref:Signal recognition particle receptor FtsY n=2 Tax=Cyanophyceae TaxID=3028117 RepID=A0A4Q7E406_9CYAN|nr:signal recognition particle-docking protein FtsY [Leptolyngbya sp. LK]RZM76094.1 signal recognition particle-docking protein FtsY [Leptolyngbya sp. LK]